MIIKRTFNVNITIDEKNPFQIGDQIACGKYTATCQKTDGDTALFMLDQYLDKAYEMNHDGSNRGSYHESDLRKELLSDFQTDSNFDSIRDILVPDQNGDIIRIPTVCEFFGLIESNFYDLDDAEQLELMKNQKNRIALREGKLCEWGWLQNTVKSKTLCFACADGCGNLSFYNESFCNGVRPVFSIKYPPLEGEELKITNPIKNDAVNHPSHYTQGGIECIEAIKASMTSDGFQDYCKGNVLKYIWRWKDKAGVEDLKKASVYLDWAIQSAEKERIQNG